jgi:hypothetical protein
MCPAKSKNDRPQVITLPLCGIVLTLSPDPPGERSGAIESEFHDGLDRDRDEDRDLATAFDVVESIILADACAGVDVTAPAYIAGIETALDAITNHLS